MKNIKLILKLCIPYLNSYIKYSRCTLIGSYFDWLKWKLFPQKTYWYRSKTTLVANSRKIFVDVNSNIGRPGVYIQGAGTVHIGKYVRFAPNIGILSVNHDPYDHYKYICKKIVIGDYSWIGMNSTILAGVELGPRTIVGASSVVTKSFKEGYVVIAGNPAKVVKYLDRSKFKPLKNENEFYGFIPKEKFEKVRHKYIDI